MTRWCPTSRTGCATTRSGCVQRKFFGMSSTYIATRASTSSAGLAYTRAGDGPTSPLDDLRRCTSISMLRSALYALCSQHGQLRHLDIVAAAQAGRRQALCFLRMQTKAEEQSLVHALGIGRFGGEVVLVVHLSSATDAAASAMDATMSVSVTPAELDSATGIRSEYAPSDWLAAAPQPCGPRERPH